MSTHSTPPTAPLPDATLLHRIATERLQDPVLQAIIDAKQAGHRRIPHNLIHGPEKLRIELGDCVVRNHILYVKDRVYVPQSGDLRTRVIKANHASLCGGHGGKHATYSKLQRWYYWPRMTTDVAQYTRNCAVCRRTKSYRQGKHGLLHPLPIPHRYWSSISMDFITHLPACHHNGQTFTNILVIVDRLTKKKKFIPMASLRVDALVQAFVEYVWREEGYPDEIISDRGSQFVSHF